MLPAQHDDGQIGVEVGIVVNLHVGFGVQGDLLKNLKALLAAKFLEIGDGQETDVGRIVPVEVLQCMTVRRPALFGQLPP